VSNNISTEKDASRGKKNPQFCKKGLQCTISCN